MEEKVYLVVAGAYSDYHEVAVFKTREEAERFCNVYNRQRGDYSYGSADIHEMTLGLQIDYENDLPFEVIFDKDGTLRDGQSYYHSIRPQTIEDIDFKLDKIPCIIEQRAINDPKESTLGYLVTVFAKDFNSALKQASDILAQYRAQKEGV